MKKVLALVLALVMMSCLSVTAFAAGGSTTITLTVPEHGGHTHTWGTECSYDENGHWYTCSGCSEKKDYEAHDFSVPQHDGTQHWNKCAKCDATDTKADHTGGTWLHDSEYHWKDCTVVGCGTIVATKEAHSYSNDADATCNICGYERAVAHAHSYQMQSNATEHWEYCPDCESERVGSREAHRGGYATTTAKAICEVCHTEYGELAVTVASGICGDPEVNSGNDVTWTLDSAGTLTISGTGNMANYPGNVYNATPWATERSNIKRIVIESGVTRIGDNAFKSCSAVEHIAISNTVTAVGDSAFSYCASLRRIQLPDSITEMGDYAFRGCAELKFANIPSQLTTVPTAMFYECSKLIDVPIPSSVTVIEDYAFKDCPSLTSVTIPEGVTEIGGYAFANCIAIKAVVLPTTMTKIDPTAFANIKNTAWIYYNGTKEQLDAMIAPATLETQNFVTAYTNSQNAGRKIPPTSGNLGVMGKETDVKWVLDNGTLTITGSGRTASWVTAPWYALKNSINKIVVGEGITHLGGGFGDHYHMTEISLPDSLAFCPDGLVENCCELTEITLPDGITKVGISAFNGCDVLKSVTLPKTITTISNYAFRGCDALTDIYFGGTEAEWTAVTVGTNNEPLANAAVHYGTVPTPAEYDITVTGGTASIGAGATVTKATADTVITIIAGTAPTGQEFDKWVVISGGITLDNANSATTTFTMPANAVSIKATYKTHVHSGGTATCTEQAICTKCGQPYGELAAHNHNSTWKSDASGHWKECVCGDKSTVNAHTPNRASATETEAVKCTVCDFVITPATGHISHSPESAWKADGTQHWHKCVGCEEKLNIGNHTGGSATCTAKAKCEVCGAEYGDLAAHDYSVPQHDGTQHWNKCSKCDATDTKADHTGGEWLHDETDHWKDCTVTGCGTIVATKAAHEFGTDKVCDICGYEKTVTVAPKLLEGNHGKFVKGGKDGLSFRSSAEFADFIRASVDGHILGSDKYTVKSGSTIVTLKADYLDTLSVGNHTLTITSTTGSVDADFTIEAEQSTDDPSSPTTGDSSNMFLWIALMFVSGIALIGTIVFGKKKKSVR